MYKISGPVAAAVASTPDYLVPDAVTGDVAVARMQELVAGARSNQLLLSILLNGDSRLSGFTTTAYYKSHAYYLRQWARSLFPGLTLGSGFDGCYFETDGVNAHDVQFGYFPSGSTTWSKYNWLDCVGRKGYRCTNTASEPFVIPFDPAVNSSSTPATPFGAAKYIEIYTMGTAKDGSGVKTGGGGRFTWSIYQGSTVPAFITGGTAPAVGITTDRIATGTISTNSNMGDGTGTFWSGTRSGILNAAAALDPTQKAILVIYPDTTNAGGGNFIIEGFNTFCDEVTISSGKVTNKRGIQVHHQARAGATLRWAQGWLGATNLPVGPQWQPTGPEGWIRPFTSDSCSQNPTVQLLPEFDAGIMIENADINDYLNTDTATVNLSDWVIRLKACVHEMKRHNCLWLKVSDVTGRGTLGLDLQWTYSVTGTTKGSLKEWDAAFDTIAASTSDNQRVMARLNYRQVKGGGDYTATSGVQGDGQPDCIHENEYGVPKKMGAIIGVLEGGTKLAAASGNGMFRDIGPAVAYAGTTPLLWFDSSRQDTLRSSSDGTQVPTQVELGVKYPYWKDLTGSGRVAIQSGATNLIPTLDCIGKAIGMRCNSQQIGFTTSGFYDFNLGWSLYVVSTVYDLTSFPTLVLKSNNGLRDINLGLDSSFQCIQATSSGSTANVSAGKIFGAPTSPSITYGTRVVNRWIYRAGDKVLRYRYGPVGSTNALDALTFGEWTVANVGFQTLASGAGLQGIQIGTTAGSNVVFHEIYLAQGDVSDTADAGILAAFNKKWKAC